MKLLFDSYKIMSCYKKFTNSYILRATDLLTTNLSFSYLIFSPLNEKIYRSFVAMMTLVAAD